MEERRACIYLATTNAGKIAEFTELFEPHGFAVRVHPSYLAPAEDAPDYAGNAALKSVALARILREHATRAISLGDDSGLEVSALGGRPGIHSARFLGADATWEERRAALLAEIAATNDPCRDAAFVCALHAVDANGRFYAASGIARGRIAAADRGSGGFSYDPIFIDVELGCTYAELSREEKNARSHRARAVRFLLRLLEADGEGAASVQRTSSDVLAPETTPSDRRFGM